MVLSWLVVSYRVTLLINYWLIIIIILYNNNSKCGATFNI